MMRTIQADIAIIGASLGGVQAARAACMHGMKVYLCEETDWIGGQLTSQAVPPDEHRWIEEQGAPQSYLDYRKAVREYYRHLPDASELLKQRPRSAPVRAGSAAWRMIRASRSGCWKNPFSPIWKADCLRWTGSPPRRRPGQRRMK